MITGPDFILLDEPFTGIDPIAIQELQRIIRALKARGLGVLITDHSVRETLRIVRPGLHHRQGHGSSRRAAGRDRRFGRRPPELSGRGFPPVNGPDVRSARNHETAPRPAAGPEAHPGPGPAAGHQAPAHDQPRAHRGHRRGAVRKPHARARGGDRARRSPRPRKPRPRPARTPGPRRPRTGPSDAGPDDGGPGRRRRGRASSSPISRNTSTTASARSPRSGAKVPSLENTLPGRRLALGPPRLAGQPDVLRRRPSGTSPSGSSATSTRTAT